MADLGDDGSHNFWFGLLADEFGDLHAMSGVCCLLERLHLFEDDEPLIILVMVMS